MVPPRPVKRKSILLGIGLDHRDGHHRLTTAEKFAIVGGSASTHERMTETLVKTCEDLKRRGRDLEEASTKEVAELLHKHTP